MSDDTKELAIFEEIRKDITLTDGSEYKVPVAAVFGRGTLAKTESFGGRTLAENSQLVDIALANTQDLQNIWNRSHTQWSWKHLNLSYHSPYKNMRQIAAEVTSKKAALNEAKWKQVKNEVKIRKLEEKLSAPGLEYWEEVEGKVKLAQLREGMAEGSLYIEGAMKDVLALNDLYEQLKAQVSDFSEEDVEREESKAHLKRSLVQCIRDVRQSGNITKGEQEYMEQIGVNPGKIQRMIREYVAEEAVSNSWDTNGLHDFVDHVVSNLIDTCKVDEIKMNRMGFKQEATPGLSFDKKVALLTKKED